MADAGGEVSQIFIRRGTLADHPRVLDLGEAMASEGWYAKCGLKWDRERASAAGLRYMSQSSGLLLVAERGTDIIGFLMAHDVPYFAFNDHYSEEFLTFVKPAARGNPRLFIGLFNAWEDWARNYDCKELYFAPSIKGGPMDFEPLLMRLGWERSGVAFRRALR